MTKTDSSRPVRGLGRVPSYTLARELDRRRSAASRLAAKRTNLLAELADLEAEIRAFGGSLNGHTPHGSAGRPQGGRTMTLPQALAKLLEGKTMSVTDMTQAVQKAGYKTNSPNFYVIVNTALLKHKNLFRRVSRGLYTAR